MKNIFLKVDENRLRAGWRLVVFISFALLFVRLFNGLVQYLGGVPDDLTNAIAVRGVIVVFMSTIIVYVVRKWIDKRSFKSLGILFNQRSVKDLFFGFMLSGFMVVLIFSALLFMGVLEVTSIGWEGSAFRAFYEILFWAWGIGFAVGWSEEIVFRGYLLQNFGEAVGLRWAVLIMCIMYGVVHMPNPNSSILSGSLLAVLGFLRIFGWLRTGQLWVSMGMHAGWNFFQGPVFGFQVSGVEVKSLIHQTLTGPEWLTGGVFGPEASFLIIPAILVALAAMYWWGSKDKETPWCKHFKGASTVPGRQ